MSVHAKQLVLCTNIHCARGVFTDEQCKPFCPDCGSPCIELCPNPRLPRADLRRVAGVWSAVLSAVRGEMDVRSWQPRCRSEMLRIVVDSLPPLSSASLARWLHFAIEGLTSRRSDSPALPPRPRRERRRGAHQILRRIVGNLMDNSTDGVGYCGVKNDWTHLHACKIHTHLLTGLKHPLILILRLKVDYGHSPLHAQPGPISVE